MGLFDWLRGKPSQAVATGEDVIWMTPSAKGRGLLSAVEQSLPAASLVIVAAHFPATLEWIQAELTGRGLAYAELTDPRRAAAIARQAVADREPHLLVALAETLVPDGSTASEQSAGQAAHAFQLEIIAAERHFHRALDERIVAFATSLGCRARVTFHLSLRDPLLQAFAGAWIESVLGRLGAKESEPIASNIVSRRLRGAQDKFAQRAVSAQPAASAEEWLERNAPMGSG